MTELYVMNFTYLVYSMNIFFFFFQAEDGIRDLTVTGVQTCALPILSWFSRLKPPRSSLTIFELGSVVQCSPITIDFAWVNVDQYCCAAALFCGPRPS